MGPGITRPTPNGVAPMRRCFRVGPVRYADGISTPAPQGGVGRPGPREISNVIVDAGESNPDDERSLAAMIYAWGQFIDHDMDLTTNAYPAPSRSTSRPDGRPALRPGRHRHADHPVQPVRTRCPGPAPARRTRASSRTRSPPSSTARWSTARMRRPQASYGPAPAAC